ncbi:flavodoxin reductase [Flavobacterium sp. GP15]|uniref:flavodoxin reductase n=1 Tax=Flavobacterium sp. GP15 TaxID=2758567 RepID=UPI00165E82E6|nr:flavodoxin reductase [Flavobacterium sp. GP15]
MSQIVKISSLEKITHDVLKVQFEKPNEYSFIPGQAADISFNEPEWSDKLSCFTFTSLPEENYLEFTIKTYPSRKRVTNKFLSANVGDELLLNDPFGDIKSHGEGVFIAGGAGITPFIAILKVLEMNGEIGNSKLIFANKTAKDIIAKDYFDKILGKNFINVLSDESLEGYEHGYINNEIIKKYVQEDTPNYYLCGPPPMMESVIKSLNSIGIKESQIIKESY